MPRPLPEPPVPDAPPAPRRPQGGAAAARAERQVALLLGLAAFGLYVVTAAPTVFWLDSSELTGAAVEIGIAHPPGHPLFVLLGKLATWIPVGTVAFRVHLLCAALCAVSVAMAVLFAVRLWGPRALPAAAAMGALLAVSMPFWFHGVRTEVYPLHLVMALTLVLLANDPVAHGGPGAVAAAGFVSGLALANHHYLAAFLAPGLLVLMLSTRAARVAFRRGLGLAVLGLVFGLAPYVLIPIRSAAFPIIRWGNGERLSGFLWILTAKAFQKTAGRVERAAPGEILRHLGHFLSSAVGPVVLALAALGLVLLARRHLAAAAGVTLLLVGNWVTQALFDFDPDNPDVAGYFLLGVWLLAVLAVGPLAAARQVGARFGRWARGAALLAGPAVPLLALLALAPAAAKRADLSAFRDTDAMADAAYGFVPTDGVAITSYFETIFNLWYRQVAEARRPDVPVVHRLFRTYPGYAESLHHRFPDLDRLFAAPPPSAELDATWLRARARRRPFLIEMDPTLQADLRPFLLPAGLWVWVSPAPVPAEPWPPELAAADARFWSDLLGRVSLDQRETAGNLLWTWANQLTLFAGQGQRDAARDRLHRAEQIAPGDPDLEAMGREIGGP